MVLTSIFYRIRRYYSGEKVAPVLTIFIGGNHEASNYLQELPYGGWVAPNIYYMGYAGVVTFKGIRIGGVSGIYKKFDFRRGHFEHLPYDNSTKRSVYHYREQELFRLGQLTGTVDVMMSHDWPTDVYYNGNYNQLIRFKPHFREEIHSNTLGSPPCYELLQKLKPTYWFSGHLHCKFAAVVPHEGSNQTTEFLALDKCLPNRRFLQILEIDAKDDSSNDLHYDLEWLTILQSTKHLTHVSPQQKYMPSTENTSTERVDFRPTEDELNAMRQRMADNLLIPKNFERTAPPYDPNPNPNPPEGSFYIDVSSVRPTQNPQTVTFCDLLNIDDPLNLVMLMSNRTLDRSDYIDNCNASMATETSFSLDDTDLTLNLTMDSTTSSGGMTSMLKTRLSIFDSLPPPKNNTEEVALELSDVEDVAPNESFAEKLEVAADVSIEEVAAKEPDVVDAQEKSESAEPSPVKKFKRRNASIYNAESED